MFEILTYFTIGIIVLILPTILAIAFGRFLMRRMSRFPLDDSIEEQFVMPAIIGGGIMLVTPMIIGLIAMFGQACVHSLVNLP